MSTQKLTKMQIIRGRLKITLGELSTMTGLPYSTLQAIDSGNRKRPYPSTLCIIADALGCDPNDLIDDEPVEKGK